MSGTHDPSGPRSQTELFLFFFFTSQTKSLLVLESYIEVGQFQSTKPQYIPISEVFWRALTKLPAVYDYAAYRTLLEKFGTHYVSEGSLGGTLSIISVIDEEMEKMTSED